MFLRRFCSFRSIAQASEPPKSWIDPDTGHRVVRLTNEPGSASLYFNQNGYTADGKKLVYTTPDGISVLDLATHEAKQVVSGTRAADRLRAQDAAHLSTSGTAPRSGRMSTPARRARLRRFRDAAPSRRSMPTRLCSLVRTSRATARTTIIAGRNAQSHRKAHSLDQPRNKGQMMERALGRPSPDGPVYAQRRTAVRSRRFTGPTTG